MSLPRGLALLGAAALAVAIAAERPAAAPPVAIDDAALDHWYAFLARCFYDCPTELQEAALEQAEELYQCTRGWQRERRTAADRERVLRDTTTLYGRLRGQLPAIDLRLDETGAQLAAEPPPMVLARGLVAHVVVEVRNTGPARTVRPEFAGTPCPFAPTHLPTGATRAFLVPLQVDVGHPAQAELRLSTELPALSVRLVVREPATLRGTLIEAETGRVWPGRVWVRGPDGVFRRDRALGAIPTVSEKPVIFRPAAWRLPFFYSTGTFELAVPPGTVEVALERGFEHPIETLRLELAPGETRAVTLTSGRFLDLRARGWISGDTHIHWATNAWNQNEDIALLGVVQRAEDLRVANNLTLYQWTPEGPFTKPDQFPMGPVPGYCDGEFHLQMGEEYRNDAIYGHVNLLGIRELIEPLATGPGSGGDATALDWPPNSVALAACRAQGGVACEAHGMGPAENGGTPVNLALGLSDVVDQLDAQYCYLLYNCGLRFALGNGSDHPARPVGAARVYVRIDGPFTYERWLDGLRARRSFVTSGPLLLLTVNGRETGEVLDVPRGTPLRVEVRALSRRPLGRVEIVACGEVVAGLETAEREATVTYQTTADEPLWFAARCGPEGVYQPLKTAEDRHTAWPDCAHTSGLWVDVDGRGAAREDALRELLARLGWHERAIAERGRFATEAQRRGALGEVARAREKLAARLDVMGGGAR